MNSHIADWRQWRSWWALRPFQQHGRVLILAGAVYVITGWSLITEPLTRDQHQSLEVALWFSHDNIEWWGTAWIIAGVLGIASARWPSFSKLWGYTALSGISAVWFFQYLAGLLFLGLPTNLGIRGAAAWGIIALLWWFISGLVNPDDVLVRDGDPDSDPSTTAAPPASPDPGG